MVETAHQREEVERVKNETPPQREGVATVSQRTRRVETVLQKEGAETAPQRTRRVETAPQRMGVVTAPQREGAETTPQREEGSETAFQRKEVVEGLKEVDIPPLVSEEGQYSTPVVVALHQ